MADYEQLVFADPTLNGLAGNWSDNCEKLRRTIRKLDGYMVMAASRGSLQADAPHAGGSQPSRWRR
jgi:hypothetical protein